MVENGEGNRLNPRASPRSRRNPLLTKEKRLATTGCDKALDFKSRREDLNPAWPATCCPILLRSDARGSPRSCTLVTLDS